MQDGVTANDHARMQSLAYILTMIQFIGDTMNYERDKKYDGTILHGLDFTHAPVKRTRGYNSRRSNLLHKVESSHPVVEKPSSSVPRHKVAPDAMSFTSSGFLNHSYWDNAKEQY